MGGIAAIVLGLSGGTTTALIAAGAALGGIILGGLITAGTTAYFERRRDEGDVRQASRLVLEEVRTIWIHAEGIVNSGRIPSPAEGMTFLPTGQWEENRRAIARHIDDETWDVLSPLMDSLPAARAVVAKRLPDSEAPDETIEHFAETRDLAADAYELLSGGQKVDETPTRPRRRRGWKFWHRIPGH